MYVDIYIYMYIYIYIYMCVYMYIYMCVCVCVFVYILKVIHDLQNAQISQNQDGRNIYAIMKTMCPPGA